jgi:uncharacterized membrane protein YkoI
MKPHNLRVFARILRTTVFCCLIVLLPTLSGIAAADDKKDPIGNLDEKLGGAKITKGEAMQAALKELPGKVTDVTVERKRGKQVYVIEIAADKDGSENDVLIDMQTGAFLGIEK